MADERIRENPLLETLLAQGADKALTFRGYASESRTGYVRIYPRLGDLSQSIEVARDAILHSVEEPKSPFGSRVFWVKKDAEIVVHQVETPELVRADEPEETREVSKGRLRIRMRGQGLQDTCVSWCSCSICECNCAAFRQVRKLGR